MTNYITNDTLVDFYAGWIGGCFGLLAGHPMDTIKVRQQTLGKTSALKGFVSTFKYEGVRGFYKGMGFPILSTGALNSIFFGVYSESLRRITATHGGKPYYRDVFLAGCVGGVAQLSVACPVEVIKIKMQLQTNGGTDSWGGRSAVKVPQTHYTGPTQCLKALYNTAGVRGCYTGLWSMAVRDVPAFGVYCLVYEYLSDFRKDLPASSILLYGGAAGALSWMLIVPLDVIKSRIQADDVKKPQYKNMWDCCVKSYRNEGFGVFWRGFGMVVLRAFPTNAAIFLAYVSSVNIMRKWFNRNDSELPEISG